MLKGPEDLPSVRKNTNRLVPDGSLDPPTNATKPEQNRRLDDQMFMTNLKAMNLDTEAQAVQ